MESPRNLNYPESPTDQDDAVYPCKGCGDILEEGKAFELAGNRWHIECFRCNTCGTLLDSDANLLLLGDGSLICNNCTYSCNNCNQKIEDLAILTGDQAFCADCFKCRNCRRRIENLRYARTSQGIFCMACHESLMARRRKTKKSKQSGSSTTILDKSLPALPPNAITQSAFTPGTESPPSRSETPTEPNSRPGTNGRLGSGNNARREVSPASFDDGHRDTLTLPASTYGETRSSMQSDRSEVLVDDGLFVPLALDPHTSSTPSPLARTFGEANRASATNEAMRSVSSERDRPASQRDYFGSSRQPPSHREALKENTRPQSSRSTSTEQKPTSPHIAYQEKKPNKLRKENATSPDVNNQAQRSASTTSDFKLQEVPESKKTRSRTNSKSQNTGNLPTPIDLTMRSRSPIMEQPLSGSPHASPHASPSFPEVYNSPYASTHGDRTSADAPRSSSQSRAPIPKRGDSLQQIKAHQVSRKEVGTDQGSIHSMADVPQRKASTSSRANYDSTASIAQLNGGRTISTPLDSPNAKHLQEPPLGVPSRSASRPSPPSAQNSDSFVAPRAPPPPPPSADRHKHTGSASTVRSEFSSQVSPTLPRYSHGGEFSLEEDMQRILRGDEAGAEDKSGVIRRVSNAVKHGRSFSDKGSRSSQQQKWKSPVNGSMDISSPISSPPVDPRDENIILRSQLRRAQQRIGSLEAEKNGLKDYVNSSADIKQVNSELREKRSTMAFLDTQRELVIKELEVMTEHLRRAKENNKALDVSELRSDIAKDYAASLQKLKDDLGFEIEGLVQQRKELNDEITNLIQMKDKGFQELEVLSNNNQQLARHNSELMQRINGHQTDSRAGQPNMQYDLRHQPSVPNGLGIYHHHQKDKSDVSMDLRNTTSHDNTGSSIHEADDSTMIQQPQLVNVRNMKGARPNMWKKGGQAITKNIKGIKGAFASSSQFPERNGSGQLESVPYGSLGGGDSGISTPTAVKSGSQKGGWQMGPGKIQIKGAANQSTEELPKPPSNTFGSDLTKRCEFEKRVVPSIVTRCIEEVELRGMDVEGIYRKSGGTGQINAIKAGFEQDNDYDISDPDLDIHAVSGTLKQYFRRLPTPLIPYNVYPLLLDSSKVEDPTSRTAGLRHAITQLPRTHRDTLEFLIFHLARVMEREKENLMTPHNIAVVFAPTIMRPMSIEQEMTDMLDQRIAVQFLLEGYREVFGAEG
ncbi:RhoGAP-domain-containing protein [Aulographum hederae CBS 113979]|uniref:RhoGAP-domain-containing protein n=1 Tax=Aulographum hederae CBS 113979 TaxID=1176131 RepID=A0A6G1HHE7_9PEZI|nr:RhoGAP-domain-containing protein [Aulographum hederae CBS 113979]